MKMKVRTDIDLLKAIKKYYNNPLSILLQGQTLKRRKAISSNKK